MFTKKEKEIMSISYFIVLNENEAMYELESKRTGQIWAIVPISLEQSVYYKLLHKYLTEDNYHFQTDCGSVLDAVLEIINHDDYKLHNRSGLFEEVLKQYT